MNFQPRKTLNTEDFVNSRGKQSFNPSGCFYTRVSGIWQTVWMETVPERYIESYKVFTDIDKGEVTFVFNVDGMQCGEQECGSVAVSEPQTNADAAALTLAEMEKASVSEASSAKVCGFKPGEQVTVKMPKDFECWSPRRVRFLNTTRKENKQ